ncbi:MAG: ABC transporter permease subunit [Candidatus Heimdallarchaeota archaeon]|nr:MAG: ABC transporter permease subunit [Candidatus Heimdallarchaeota archaeon]
MSTVKQIMALVKQELQSARRTRYVIFTFVLMPLFMWGLQGGVQMLMGFVMGSSQEGVTIYFVSYDEGIEINETHSFKLSEIFLEMLENATQTNNSILYGATINSTKYADLSYSVLVEKINNSRTASYYTPCIILHANFTEAYLSYNATSSASNIPPVIELYSLPSGILGSTMLEAGIASIIYQPPFTYHVPTDQDKLVLFSSRPVVFPREEGAASGFGVGFIGMISIMVAVLAPAPFVSTSFAGEREKKTMESLLALPISRFNILFSKLLAGMVLIGVFALMNVVGLFLFAGMIDIAAASVGSEEYATIFAIEPSITMLVLTVAMMFLSAFVAIGIGISVASLTKDVRSAESMYNMFMMVPAMGVGFIGMFGGIPERAFGGAGIILYIIPWAHSIAILSKGLYPQTYASNALTRDLPYGGIAMDLVFHFSFLIIVILVCLFIASKVFEREGILT